MRKANSLGKDAATLTVSKLITLVITMVTSMLLSRFRTIEEYGTYSQLMLVITLFTSIFMLGLPNSINYFLAKADSKEEQQKFLGVYYTISTLLSVLMGVVLALSAPLIASYFDNPVILTFVFFLLLYPWANIISSSIENVLIIYHKTGYLTVYRIINSLCMLGAVLIVQWIGLGFREYMIVNVVISICFALTVYVISYKVCGGFKPSIDTSFIKKIFVFSLPLGLATVMGTLNIEIDKLLIGFLMDTEQMAIYSNASKELPIAFIATSITAVLLPQLTKVLKKGENDKAIELWNNATELSFILISLIAIGVFTYAEDVVTLLYSEKYLPGVSVFRVYSLVLLLRCTYFGMILNAIGKTKDIFWASVASLIFNAILNPLLYIILGMIGPAIATIISMLLSILWQLKRTSTLLKISFRKIFPWYRLLITILINLGFSICFFIIKNILPIDNTISSLAESIILGLLWAILYIFVMRKRILVNWKILNQKEYANEDI